MIYSKNANDNEIKRRIKKQLCLKWFVLIFTLGCTLACTLYLFALTLDAGKIYSGVVRLHVLAESDSEQDQNLKLKVRDTVLEYMRDSIDGCHNMDQAIEYINMNSDDIKKKAKKTVRDEGYDYDVDISFCTEYYPTREYENCQLPAGEYVSLRVVIGSGQGHNWWCVLYPPLCTSSASADIELAEAGFTQNQVRLITESEDEGYVLKFKIVETVSKTINKLKRLFR